MGFKSCGKGERELLKERLQQEIAEDCEVEMVEGEGGEWEAHTTSGGESKDEKKEEVRKPDGCLLHNTMLVLERGGGCINMIWFYVFLSQLLVFALTLAVTLDTVTSHLPLITVANRVMLWHKSLEDPHSFARPAVRISTSDSGECVRFSLWL